MRRSRRLALRKSLQRLEERSRTEGQRPDRADGAAGFVTLAIEEGPTAPEAILLRRLGFAAERLSQATRPAAVAEEALALAARFSGLRQGLIVRRARSGHFVVAARRGLSSCSPAEREEVEASARQALKLRRATFDLTPSDRLTGRLLVAIPVEYDGELLGGVVLREPGRSAVLDPAARALLLGLARQVGVALRRLASHAAAASRLETPMRSSAAAEVGEALPTYAEARSAFERQYLHAALAQAGGSLDALVSITGLPADRVRALLGAPGLSLPARATSAGAPSTTRPTRRSATA